MEIWDHNANFDEAFEMEIWDHNANFGEASNIEPERLPMTNQNKGLKHNEPMRIGRNCAWSTSSEGKRVWPRRSWFSLACYWCKSGVWRDFSWPITEHDEATPMQSCDTLDSQLEIFQIWNSSLIWKMELTEHFFDRTPSKRLWLSSLRVAGAIPGHISSNQSTYYRVLLQHVGTGCEVSLRVLTL